MGPEGGSGGGQIVAVGTPEEIAANPASHTGHWLAPVLTSTRPNPSPNSSPPHNPSPPAARITPAHKLRSHKPIAI